MTRVKELLRSNPKIGKPILEALKRVDSSGTDISLHNQINEMQDQIELLSTSKLNMWDISLLLSVKDHSLSFCLYLVEKLTDDETSAKDKHLIAVSARLLETASRNLDSLSEAIGLLKFERISKALDALNKSKEATIIFRWRIGNISSHMMLLDLVGGVLDNRLSTILNDDHSILFRIYDGLGSEQIIRSEPYLPGAVLQIAFQWNRNTFWFWIGAKLIEKRTVQNALRSRWSHLLLGMDIDGRLSADTGQIGYKVDGEIGLYLGKCGKSQGGCINRLAIFTNLLSSDDIGDLSQSSDALAERGRLPG